MTGIELLNATRKSGVMPVYNHPDVKVVMSVFEVCKEAGIETFEFTIRGEGASRAFKEVRKETENWSDFHLGVGTVFNSDQARHFMEEGAEFIVSPILDEGTSEVCAARNISWTPGCMTLTEIVKGAEWGAELIKIFPAHLLGPGFVKAVKGPCPEVNIMPTGGVNQEKDNLKAWFDSGVHCVGLGSSVFQGDFSDGSNIEQLKVTLKEVVSFTSSLCA